MMRRVFKLSACLIVGGCGLDDEPRIVGQLESDRIEMTAEFAETIIERRVAEGEAVSAGQILLKQDTARIEARVAEAAATLEEARARLAELVRGPRSEKIEAARANLEGARHDQRLRRLEYDRAERLLEQNLASPANRDRARAALDAAETAVAFNEAQLEELLTGTTLEELSQAEQAVRRAQARLDGLNIDQQRHRIDAPVAGIVDSILFETGERPIVGRPVVIILGGEQPYARAYIPAEFRVAVTPGMDAVVHIDGRAKAVAGRVRWVSSDAAFTPYFALTEHDRGRLTYAAKIDLLDLDARLPDGVPVEIEFPGLVAAMEQ